MASISARMITKSAAVAGALGIAFAMGAPAANAQPADEGLNFGSLLGIFQMDALAGSVSDSLGGEGAGTGSAGSLAGLIETESLGIGVEAAQGSSGSAGSVGDAAGTLNPDGFGATVAGSVQSMSSDEEGGATGSLGELPEGSIENFFGNLGEVAGGGEGDTTDPGTP